MKVIQLNIYLLLLAAMAGPMLMLYTVSALGPEIIRKFDIPVYYLGFFNIGSFGIAAILSFFSGTAFRKLNLKIGFAMLFGLVSLSYGLMAVTNSVWGLLAVTPLIGLSQALANPLTNLFLKYTNEIKYKSFAVGVKQSGVQVGALMVGAFYPLLYSLYGMRGLFLATSTLVMLLGAYLFSVVHYPRLASQSASESACRAAGRCLYYLMAIQFLVGVVLSSFVIHISLYGVQLGLDAQVAGQLIAVFGMTGILARLVFPALGDYLKSEIWLFFGLVLVAIVSFLILVAASRYGSSLIYPATIGVGATLVTTNAIAMSLLIKYPHFGLVSRSSGWVSSMFFLGFAIGPLFSQYLAGQDDDFSAIWMLSCLLLIVVVGLVLKMRRSGFTTDSRGN